MCFLKNTRGFAYPSQELWQYEMLFIVCSVSNDVSEIENIEYLIFTSILKIERSH